VLGKVPYLRSPPPECCHFHATVAVKVDMEGCNRKIAVMVVFPGQIFGKLTGLMIVNVHHGGGALGVWTLLLCCALNTRAGEIADGFGAVLIAAGIYKSVELCH
jgi:hypothetical protein